MADSFPQRKKPVPPNRTKACPVDRRTLAHLFWNESMSKVQLTAHFSVAIGTITRWFDKYELDTSNRNCVVESLRNARMEKDGNVVWEDSPLTEANPSVSEGHLLSVAEPAQSELGKPNYLQAYDLDLVDTAYMRLTHKQREAVDLISDTDPDAVSLTTEERARKLGVQPETLKNWRREPDFIQALDEAMKPEYLSRLKEYSRRDLLQRFVDGKTTKEDRMMAAKITGDLGPDTLVQQNTQVNIQDGRLKGTF